MEIKADFIGEAKTLEEYALNLCVAMFSLKTLENYQILAVQSGLLPEDMNCRCNTIVWDFRRLIKLYHDQLESTLELLPDDFDPKEHIKQLQQQVKPKGKK